MKEPTHNDNAPDISASIGEPVALYIQLTKGGRVIAVEKRGSPKAQVVNIKASKDID
jgi:protein-L-isoaspartate O-methyltransferase